MKIEDYTGKEKPPHPIWMDFITTMLFVVDAFLVVLALSGNGFPQ